MRAKRAIKCLLAALPPLLAVAFLIGGPEISGRGARTKAATLSQSSTEVSQDLGPVVTAKVSCRHEPFATQATQVRRPRQASPDERALENALAEADRPTTGVRELQDLGSTLTRLLQQRPELGPAAARALGHLEQRNVLFQVERALRGVAWDPAVHATLMDLVAGGALDAQREAAIGALGGREDRDADAAFAQVLGDAGSGALARSAAAYELAKELDSTPDAPRAAAVASARGLVSDPTADSRVQAEAWGVLGASGLDDSDRALARTTIDKTDSNMQLALAAARALLVSGEPRAAVARALAPRGRDEPVLAAMLARLEAGR